MSYAGRLRPGAGAPTGRQAPDPAATSTLSPAVTPTAIPASPTAAPSTPTPTLIAFPTVTGAEQICVQSDQNAEFPAQDAGALVETVSADAQTYLNEGGDPSRLETALAAGLVDKVDGFKMQVLSAELTGDAVSEIALELTFSVGANRPAGDTALAVFHCVQGQYQMETLFIPPGQAAAAKVYTRAAGRVSWASLT